MPSAHNDAISTNIKSALFPGNARPVILPVMRSAAAREDQTGKRDYSAFGPDAAGAVGAGLATADWYHTDIPRKEMKALMTRADQPAIRDIPVLFGAMIPFAGTGVAP